VNIWVDIRKASYDKWLKGISQKVMSAPILNTPFLRISRMAPLITHQLENF